MPRQVRPHTTFSRRFDEQVAWLERHRSIEDLVRFRGALAAFARRISANPGVGHEVERIEARSFRVFAVGDGLPYHVWYVYSPADKDGEIELLLLLHDSQDRARFDPTEFE